MHRVLADPVLVGRESEFGELENLLASAVAGRGNTVFVYGEAGAGKTRLVKEFLRKAEKQSVTTLRGWCLSNAAVPYFPFFEAFNSYFSQEENREVELKSWLMGPPKTGVNVVTPQVWKDQTFTAVANTLASISAKHAVVLFIDDLHWADSASLALIHYLAYNVKTEKVLVIATYRSEQLLADVEGRPHPLLETLRLMRRQDLIEEINVKSLNQTGVSALAQNMLGSGIQADLAQKLSDESQGNPLFIVESLRMLNENNGLIQENQVWRLTNSSIGIPPKIKDIILQRLAVLGRNHRSVLDVAAVLGEKFDATILAEILAQDPLEVIRNLDIIAKDTSLVCCEGELFRFDHARTRDALYDDISPALRRSYHAKVAQKLEYRGGKLPLADLAYQYSQAGNTQKATKFALAAGQDALAKWSNNEAVKHFSFVIQALTDKPLCANERALALEGMGDAYYAGNNFKQAIKVYENFSEAAQNDSEKLRALRKALQASFYEGERPKQQALLAKVEKVETADRLEAARVLFQKSSAYMSPTDWAATGKLYKQALQVYDEEYALSDAAYILFWLGFGQACIGEIESGVAYALRSIALYEDLGDFRSQMEAYAYAGGTFQASELSEESNRMLAKAISVNEEHKIWDYVRLFPAYVWECLAQVGVDIPTAIAKALKALEYFEKTDSRLYAGAIYGSLIMSYAFSGQTEKVREYHKKFENLPDYIKNNAPSQVYYHPIMGIYYAAIGDFETSNKTFEYWFIACKSVFPGPFFESSSRQLYAWSLGKQGKFAEAKMQMDEAQKIANDARNRFSHTKIVASLMTQTRPNINQAFPIRLDLINVSTSRGSILEIENFPAELEIIEVSSNCLFHNGKIEFRDQTMAQFQVKTLKLIVKANSIDSFDLKPQISYIDDSGQANTTNPRPMTIAIQAGKSTIDPSSSSEACREVQSEGDEEIDILKRFGLPH